MRRLFRAVDARFLLSLTALVVAVTICWGFVQRGDQIEESEAAVASLSAQLGEVSADNRRLHRQLTRIDRESQREERQAARERELLLRELVRLNRWLRENGIVVPVATTSRPASEAGGQSGSRQGGDGNQPTPAPPNGNDSGNGSSPGNGSPGGGGKPDSPGKAPAHSNAGGNGNGGGHGPGGKPGHGKP